MRVTCGRTGVRRVLRHELAALGLLLMWGGSASAACLGQQQQVPPAQVQSFMDDPGGALRGPNGGSLVSRIRDLVSSDERTLAPVIELLRNADPEQRAAIGTALGQAARVCLRVLPQFAAQIQQALANSGIPEAILAFAATTGDNPTAALGPGGFAGSGGGLGGALNGGNGANGGQSSAFQAFTANSTPSSRNSAFGGVSTGVSSLSALSAPGTTSTTTAVSASP